MAGLKNGETAVDAALRETHEEIGIAPSDARVIGELKQHVQTVVSNSHIVPIVASYETTPTFLAP